MNHNEQLEKLSEYENFALEQGCSGDVSDAIRTVREAYLYAFRVKSEYPVFDASIFDRTIPHIIDVCRHIGTPAIIVTTAQCGIADVLQKMTEQGATLDGLTTINVGIYSFNNELTRAGFLVRIPSCQT